MMLLFLIAYAPFNLNLNMKSEATINRDTVYLSDLLDKDSYQQLKAHGMDNVSMATGPNVGNERVIRRFQVAGVVQRAMPDAKVRWGGAPATVVSRKSMPFKTNDLESQVREWVESQSPEAGQLHLDQVVIPSLPGLPAGKVSYRIRNVSRNLVGRHSLYVDLEINGETYRTLVVQVNVSLETMVAIARTDIQRGDALSESNIDWELQHLTRVPAPLVTPEAVGESRARSMLRAGSVLTSRNVERIPLVERNQVVTVMAVNGPLSIRMKAKAMDSGGEGDRVRLKNEDSGEILSGTVTRPGEVEIRVGY